MIDKLKILSDAAKYDVACTSSGTNRAGAKKNREVGGMGSAVAGGICHAFSADGRCVSLLKILMSNVCVYDCQYCACRRSNDIPRATFTPKELAELTINFYKRNYIEGLFLSSAVVGNPDLTMEMMINAIGLIRREYKFNGYIHAKAIPNASQDLINQLGMLVDRMSVNIELPSEESLKQFAPEKSKQSILKPMGVIRDNITQTKNEIQLYRNAPKFVPAGQSTQMIIGATPETDKKIITLTEGLYDKFNLKRVFYSAYIPVGTNPNLPAPQDFKPPLVREHRLYQADWLLRFYGFKADELLTEQNPNFHEQLDPKCVWALNNLHMFPMEINKVDLEMLLRIPGIGQVSANRIVAARRLGSLNFDHLKKMGVVLKRARYFIVCNGKTFAEQKINEYYIENNLLYEAAKTGYGLPQANQQVSMFELSDVSLSLGSGELR